MEIRIKITIKRRYPLNTLKIQFPIRSSWGAGKCRIVLPTKYAMLEDFTGRRQKILALCG